MKAVLLNLLILSLVLVSAESHAQEKNWYEGKIILHNHQQLQGLLCYNWDGQVVQLRLSDGRIRAFSAAQVASFALHDGMSPIRLFTSLPLALPGQKQSLRPDQLVFLEKYLSGPLVVMRRLKTKKGLLSIRMRKPINVVNNEEFYPDHDTFEYFVYDGTTFRELTYFYRDIEPLMIDYQRELTGFVDQHNLNTRLTSVQLMLVNRFNQLKLREEATASAP